MGHTNSTVNYNLPQFVGSDKPSWLGDVNGAFLAIDTAIAAAKTEADSAAGGVAGLQTTVSGHTTQIGTLTDTVTAQGGTLNSVTALIGNGTPTTTDQTIIGAINEIVGKTFYKEIHTAANNQSWGNQAAVLKTYFNALATTDKLRAVILRGANVFHLVNSGGTFIQISGDGNGLGATAINLATETVHGFSVASGGTTVTPLTDTTDNLNLTLALI